METFTETRARDDGDLRTHHCLSCAKSFQTIARICVYAGRAAGYIEAGQPDLADKAWLSILLTAGIVMDTATFAHPNATPRTLRVAAALVEAGAPLSEISRRLYRTKPDAQLALFGRVLARLERHADGLVIASAIELADLVATGARSDHSEGIIDLLAQSESAEIALVLKEKGAETRLSVRTKPGGVDATVLTGTWGGGGHARAAGATVPLPLAGSNSRPWNGSMMPTMSWTMAVGVKNSPPFWPSLMAKWPRKYS